MMTKLELLKKPVRYLPWCVYAAAALLVAATVARVSGHGASKDQAAAAIEQCKVREKETAQKAKEVLAEQKSAGDRLKQKNAFVPPPERPGPPACQGIIGQSALFGDTLYKAGEKVGEAEIISVGTTEVVIKWQGAEMKLDPFGTDGPAWGGPRRGADANARTGGPAPAGGPGQRGAATQGGGAGGQGKPAVAARPAEPMKMSSQERQEVTNRFRNMSPEEQAKIREQRQQSEERGGR